MKKEVFDKKIIIWILVLLIPIIFTIVVVAIKGVNDNKPKNEKISRVTYVHVFYVKDTDSLDKVKNTLGKIDEPFKVVYHDITEENDLYQKVLDYLEITIRVYNPLIMINSNYFTEEYDLYSLKNGIIDANKTYSKEKLSDEEYLKYNVVDRLESGEEVYESTQ